MRLRIAPSPDDLVLDQLRAHWLAAIFESGPAAARDDAVAAFMERMRCSRAAAEALVDKAWSRLKLDVHATAASCPRDYRAPSADALEAIAS